MRVTLTLWWCYIMMGIQAADSCVAFFSSWNQQWQCLKCAIAMSSQLYTVTVYAHVAKNKHTSFIYIHMRYSLYVLPARCRQRRDDQIVLPRLYIIYIDICILWIWEVLPVRIACSVPTAARRPDRTCTSLYIDIRYSLYVLPLLGADGGATTGSYWHAFIYWY